MTTESMAAPRTGPPREGAGGTVDIEDYRRAMLNILEDFAAEKGRLEEMHRATLNILEDFAAEKARLEQTQRAMLNLLDDFGMEREKTEAINRELREAEDQVKKSLREKEALLKEIHHRVKNNLQIIHSMLNLQLPHFKDGQAVAMFKESRDRVYSMALIHEKLYHSRSLAKIDLAGYIDSLVANLFVSYGALQTAVRPEILVENVTLGVDTVVPCALIINELVSNSLKHAFPPSWRTRGEIGEIRIELRHGPGHTLVLTVADNGVGLPPEFRLENTNSLGLKLVDVLVRQLNGTLKINERGKAGFVIAFVEIKRGGE